MFQQLSQRFLSGWDLGKQSLQVLRMDKELLLFPVLSGIACTLVMLSFAVPIWFSGALEGIENEPQGITQNALTYVVLFAYYFVNYFVIIFLRWLTKTKPVGRNSNQIILVVK